MDDRPAAKATAQPGKGSRELEIRLFSGANEMSWGHHSLQ